MENVLLVNQPLAFEYKLSLSEAIVFQKLYWKSYYLQKMEVVFNRFDLVKQIPLVSTKLDTFYRIYKNLERKGLILFRTENWIDYLKILKH